MKKYFIQIASMFILAWAVSFTAWGQFDDIYFAPDDAEFYAEAYEDEGGDTYVTNNYYYDDDEYDYYDDDYYYSSRIRRFHRPFVSVGFYDPFFYDPFYYGSTYAMIGHSPFRWNRYNRWSRFGYYDPFYSYYDPFYYPSSFRRSYLSCYFGFGNFYSPSYYYSPGYYHSAYGYGGYGYGNRSYWDYGYQPLFYNTSSRGYYYGSRKGGSVKAAPSTVVNSPRVPSNTGRNVLNGPSVTNVRGKAGVSDRSTVTINKPISSRSKALTGTYRTPRIKSEEAKTAIRRPSTNGKNYQVNTTTKRRTDSKVYSPQRSNTRVISPNTTRSNINRRSYTPNSTRSSGTYKPSTSSSQRRTFTPSRKSSSPSRSYSPSSRTRSSYSPSRSSGSNRSYTPSRSSGSSRSYTPSRSSGSSSRSSGSSGASSPRRHN